MNKNAKKIVHAAFLLFLSLLIGAVVYLIKFPLGSLFFVLLNHLYHANQNIFIIPQVQGIAFFIWIYLFLGLSGLAVFGARSLAALVKAKPPQSARKHLFAIAAVFCAVFTVFQTENQHRYLCFRTFQMSGKSAPERQAILLGPSERFSQECLKYIKGRHGGKLITDLDLSQTLEPYIIAYALYPAVDLLTNDGRGDCLVLYEKKNAPGVVPKDFRILKSFGTTNLIALKEGAAP